MSRSWTIMHFYLCRWWFSQQEATHFRECWDWGSIGITNIKSRRKGKMPVTLSLRPYLTVYRERNPIFYMIYWIYTVKYHFIFKVKLLTFQSTSSLESNLEGLASVLEADLTTYKAKILKILSECALKLPDKCTIYTTLIGLLNTKNYNFGGEVRIFWEFGNVII